MLPLEGELSLELRERGLRRKQDGGAMFIWRCVLVHHHGLEEVAAEHARRHRYRVFPLGGLRLLPARGQGKRQHRKSPIKCDSGENVENVENSDAGNWNGNTSGAKGSMDEDDDWDDAFLSTIDALETSHLQRMQRDEQQVTAEGRWACRSCTLRNDASRTTCEVCRTPRGQVFQSASGGAVVQQHAGIASSPPSSQGRRTVQATLPFGWTGSGAPPHPMPTVPPKPVDSTLSAQRSSRQSTSSARPSRPPTVPTARSANQLNTSGFQQVSGPRDDGGNRENGHGGSLALATAQLRHKGEDPVAKTRYYADTEDARHPRIDRQAAELFIYPTNYSVREYQLSIAEKALYHNTLVSLPTGLGKTLIASVVMYNFYRWFPEGQIVFMAPTKPLVAQQIGACHEIMGIPLSDTAELQGSVPPVTRKILWKTKRVFFCTPQSMQNDLQRGICQAERLVCLVVDEAHRATGNYAYCGVIQEVEKRTKNFRVLALSATPGSKFDVIQDVIRNLRITHIESRCADDADVKKYTHARQEEVIKCSLSSQIAETKTLFLQVFQRIVQRLFVASIIQHKDPERLSKYYVLQMRQRFRESPNYQSNRSAEGDLALLVTLLHARDLLTGHGLASFKTCIDDFVEENSRPGVRLPFSKRELMQSTEFQALRLSLENVNVSESANTSSHPKLLKLREVLHEHFQRHAAGQSSTRAIVFTQFRSSVQEIVKLLEPLAPLIKAQQFVGQGASGKSKESKGQSQKEQQEIVRKFRSGMFNVLVATCIAEEGLDIGEVDLIVSFDALTSPVRMIQRMGRTGRKRVGKVIILVTEGDEEKKLARSVAAAKTVSRALTTFKSKFEYMKCPRMLPHDVIPELAALAMEIPEYHASQVAGKQSAAPRHAPRGDNDGSVVKSDAWKLNELEITILRAKYTPSDWSERPRNEIVPVTASRKTLLRRRRSCADQEASPKSSRSFLLQALVRKINNVGIDDEELQGRSASLSHYEEFTAERSASQEIITFSDPDDLIDNGSMHFSPQYSGVASALSPVRTSFSANRSMLGKKSPSDETKPRPSPHRNITSNNKQTPSPGKRASTGSARKSRKRVEKPRDAIDEGILQRGEKLLAKLSDLLACASDAPTKSVDVLSPEPEPGVDVEMTSETMDVQLDFPRIARRLEFGDMKSLEISSTTATTDVENCVPLPPASIQDDVRGQEVVQVGVLTANHDTAQDTWGTRYSLQAAQTSAAQQTQPRCANNRNVPGRLSEHSPEHSGSLQDVLVNLKPNMKPSRDAGDKDLAIRKDGISASLDHVSPDSWPKPQKKRPLALRNCSSTDAVMTSKVGSGSKSTETNSSPILPACTLQECVSRHTPTQRSSRSSQGEPCSICCDPESFDDDPIVFCDGCEVGVHQFCYGIPVIPSDEWYCDACTENMANKRSRGPDCVLCPFRTRSAALKRAACGRWVHVQCFLWIPELRFHYESNRLILGSTADLDPDRRSLHCSLCNSRHGHGIIQCAHKRCLVAFHVSCASAAADANYKVIQLDQGDGDDSTTLFVGYCPLHIRSTSIWKPAHKSPDKATPGTPRRVDNVSGPTTASPSALLASQIDSAKKQRKQFRRLKRKYETAIASQATPHTTPPMSRSPWSKRVRRSEGRRGQAKALAKMFIEEEAEAPSGSDDDDDDDDDDMDEDDESFINDSSQLIYSPSVPTPVRERKKKRNSLGDMRAIYARSLIESPQRTPRLLRRGRHMLPSNGIISACLEELDKGNDSDESSAASETASHEGDDEQHEVIQMDSQDNSLSLDNSRTSEGEFPTEIQAPSFSLLGQQVESESNAAFKPIVDSSEEENRLREKIEANRQKALQLLEAKKQVTLSTSEFGATSKSSKVAARQPALCSTEQRCQNGSEPPLLKSVESTPAFDLLAFSTSTVAEGPPSTSSTDSSVGNIANHPRIPVYVLQSSPALPILDAKLQASSHPVLDTVRVDELEADALLSLRVSLVQVDPNDIISQDLQRHPRLELAMNVFKMLFVIVVARDVEEARRVSSAVSVDQLRSRPNCRGVAISSDIGVLVKALLKIAREETKLGFGFDTANSSSGVDVHFHDRFKFFQATQLLSIGSIISLSFRFDKFQVHQIPVTKFNEMHWRRMLPWVSENTAKQLYAHFSTQL